MSFLDNIFIIHVSEGYEERREHIDRHLPEKGFHQYEYMLDGDIKDLTPEVLKKYFSNSHNLAEKSCAYKHIRVYEEMVARNIETALVFEDDAFLTSHALEQLKKVEKEMASERNYIVNIEQSNRSVPLYYKQKGKLCYIASHTKRTGGYIIHLDVAKKFVQFFESNTTAMPSDAFQTNMRKELQYNTFWMDPPIVQQGSKDGTFESELSKRKKSRYTAFSSVFRDFYQRYILTNLSKKRYRSFQNVVKY